MDTPPDPRPSSARTRWGLASPGLKAPTGTALARRLCEPAPIAKVVTCSGCEHSAPMEHLWVSDYTVWLDCRFCGAVTPVDVMDSDPTDDVGASPPGDCHPVETYSPRSAERQRSLDVNVSDELARHGVTDR
jgi:hypothetical protein